MKEYAARATVEDWFALREALAEMPGDVPHAFAEQVPDTPGKAEKSSCRCWEGNPVSFPDLPPEIPAKTVTRFGHYNPRQHGLIGVLL